MHVLNEHLVKLASQNHCGHVCSMGSLQCVCGEIHRRKCARGSDPIRALPICCRANTSGSGRWPGRPPSGPLPVRATSGLGSWRSPSVAGPSKQPGVCCGPRLPCLAQNKCRPGPQKAGRSCVYAATHPNVVVQSAPCCLLRACRGHHQEGRSITSPAPQRGSGPQTCGLVYPTRGAMLQQLPDTAPA